jgi:hypothetical protein
LISDFSCCELIVFNFQLLPSPFAEIVVDSSHFPFAGTALALAPVAMVIPDIPSAYGGGG